MHHANHQKLAHKLYKLLKFHFSCWKWKRLAPNMKSVCSRSPGGCYYTERLGLHGLLFVNRQHTKRWVNKASRSQLMHCGNMILLYWWPSPDDNTWIGVGDICGMIDWLTAMPPYWIYFSTIYELRANYIEITRRAPASANAKCTRSLNFEMPQQEAQLSQSDGVTLRVIEYFAVTQSCSTSFRMTHLSRACEVPVIIPLKLCISYRFWDIQHQIMAWPWNRG